MAEEVGAAGEKGRGLAMEMHQVRYFLAVARTLNFTRAAEQCCVSQPALTRAIQLLEEELGGKLMRREGKLSHLTDLGQRMLPLMQQCYDSAHAAKSLATSFRKGSRQALSFALSQAIALELVTPALAEIQRAFPGAQINILRTTGDDIGEQLKRGHAEVAVAGPLGRKWERIDAWPLFEESLVLVVHRDHKLAGSSAIGSEQLRRERILVNSACEAAQAVARALDEQGIAAADGYQSCSHHDLVTLLEANLGVAFLPQSTALGPTLRRVQVVGLDLRRQVLLYGVAGRQRSPAGEALMKLLRARDWSLPPS